MKPAYSRGVLAKNMFILDTRGRDDLVVVPRLVAEQGVQRRAPGLELDRDAAARNVLRLVEHRVREADRQHLAALELAAADQVRARGRAPDGRRVRRCRRPQRQVPVDVDEDVVLRGVVRVELVEVLRLERQAKPLLVVRVGFPLENRTRSAGTHSLLGSSRRYRA